MGTNVKDGKLTFSAKKIFIGSNWLSLPISSSPALTASIDAMRKDGKLTFSAKKIFIGSNWLSLPISSSPALTASIDAMRVCICIAARPKLFLVAGNKPCIASPNFCI
ncbi:hypothetical protein Tcan_07757 [Toxocara canis]|uniref:Uncharacterized protein n=1 Tax=Toxocara canis TaxID=6265 RepID=A0A0B2UU16_TOXCA|nr:hypothetical protein Tcan_07757 [Toxocara canis]